MKRQQKQVQKSWGFVDRDKTTRSLFYTAGNLANLFYTAQ